MATQCSLSSLELRVQFCLLVRCTYPSSSTGNKEKKLIDQRASLRVDTRETQQINWRRRHWDFPHKNASYRRSYPIRSFSHLYIVSTMAETTELIKLLADQMQVQRQQMEQQAKQMEQYAQQHRAEMEQQAQQMEQHSQQHRAEMKQQAQHHREEMHNLLKDVQKHGTGEDDSSTHHPQLSTAAIPPCAAFDSTSELLLYTNNWLTWLLNKLQPRTSTS